MSELLELEGRHPHSLEHRVSMLERDVAEIKSFEPRLSHIERLLLQVRAGVIVLVAVVVLLKFGFAEAVKLLL